MIHILSILCDFLTSSTRTLKLSVLITLSYFDLVDLASLIIAEDHCIFVVYILLILSSVRVLTFFLVGGSQLWLQDLFLHQISGWRFAI